MSVLDQKAQNKVRSQQESVFTVVEAFQRSNSIPALNRAKNTVHSTGIEASRHEVPVLVGTWVPAAPTFGWVEEEPAVADAVWPGVDAVVYALM